MRIGGALLVAQRCSQDLSNFDLLDSGDIIKRRQNLGRWESDGRFTGANDCWHQSGHNYFSIKFPERPGTWVNNVSGDEQKQM
jgi:hypothetical protein